MTASGESADLDGFAGPDPAERSAFNRLFYRNRRPTRVGHWVSQFFCWWARLGLPPESWVALRIRDRESGWMRQDAVVIPTVAGQRYVVSMFGTISDWVHNLEAANGDAVISHGGSMRVHLVKIPADQRAPILREYVRVASSGRKHFPLPVGAPLPKFAAIASQYPVYRIETVPRRRGPTACDSDHQGSADATQSQPISDPPRQSCWSVRLCSKVTSTRQRQTDTSTSAAGRPPAALNTRIVLLGTKGGPPPGGSRSNPSTLLFINDVA